MDFVRALDCAECSFTLSNLRSTNEVGCDLNKSPIYEILLLEIIRGDLIRDVANEKTARVFCISLSI
jgi:hypothetical protein